MSATTVVLVSPDELERLITSAVEKAIAEQRQDAGPVLLDRNGIAKALGVGTSTVDRLRRDGLPVVLLGDAPRFELDACLAWLRGRSA